MCYSSSGGGVTSSPDLLPLPGGRSNYALRPSRVGTSNFVWLEALQEGHKDTVCSGCVFKFCQRRPSRPCSFSRDNVSFKYSFDRQLSQYSRHGHGIYVRPVRHSGGDRSCNYHVRLSKHIHSSVRRHSDYPGGHGCNQFQRQPGAFSCHSLYYSFHGHTLNGNDLMFQGSSRQGPYTRYERFENYSYASE